LDNIITVGGSLKDGTHWLPSNFGQNTVHLFAPAEDLNVMYDCSTLVGELFL